MLPKTSNDALEPLESWGEWDESFTPNLEEPHRECKIDRVSAADLSREDFEKQYLEKKPVIIISATNSTDFKLRTEKTRILRQYKDYVITLSTANTNSYHKESATFGDYVTTMMHPQQLNVSGIDSKYMFGDNKHLEWHDLFQHYAKPMTYVFGKYQSLSFGMGGSGSGVPFHTHAHVFAEVFYGKKRWFLQAPGPDPEYDPNSSNLQWLTNIYPKMEQEAQDKILDCTCDVGEMLYIPTFWHHSTLNIGQTVFMSTFV